MGLNNLTNSKSKENQVAVKGITLFNQHQGMDYYRKHQYGHGEK